MHHQQQLLQSNVSCSETDFKLGSAVKFRYRELVYIYTVRTTHIRSKQLGSTVMFSTKLVVK